MILKLAITLGCLLLPGFDGDPGVGPKVDLVGIDQLVLSGTLEPAPDGTLGLQTNYFAEVLNVSATKVVSLAFDQDSKEKSESSEPFYFRLRGDQVLFGNLLGVTPEGWSIAAHGLGDMLIPTELMERVEWLKNPKLVYSGPHGLLGWGVKREWKAEDLRLNTQEGRARLSRDLGLDGSRVLSLKLHWDSAVPRFRLVLGSKSASASAKGVTLEMMGEDLYATSIVDGELKLVKLSEGLPASKELDIHANITEKLIVFSDADGKAVGQLERGEGSGKYLVLMNDGKSLGLSSLIVADGGLDGAGIPGRLQGESIGGFDAEQGMFETEEGPVALSGLRGIDFEVPSDSETKSTSGIELKYGDGRRIQGDFVRVQESGISLLLPFEETPRVCSMEDLVSLETLDLDVKAQRRKPPRAHLETGKMRMGGELVRVGADGQITWKLSISEQELTLIKEDFDSLQLNRVTAYFVSRSKAPHSLHLRSGEIFRCKLLAIDDEGLAYQSMGGEPARLDSSLVKAIEFNRGKMRLFRKLIEAKPVQQNQGGFFGGHNGVEVRRETSAGLDRASLDRALALPRKYKHRPFTNLIVARTGDFLRTEPVTWKPGFTSYSSGFAESRKVEDKRVAAIVWLAEGEAPETPEGSVLVHLSKEVRLLVRLTGMEEGHLLARSEVHGDLRIPTRHILRITLNSGSEELKGHYDDWVLSPMKEPFPDGETEAPEAGAEETPGEDGSSVVLPGGPAGKVVPGVKAIPIAIPVQVRGRVDVLKKLEEPEEEIQD